MSNAKKDRTLNRKFIRQSKEIIGRCFTIATTIEEQHDTGLELVLEVPALKLQFLIHVSRWPNVINNPNKVDIRYMRVYRSGTISSNTENQKILEGYGTHLLTLFIDEEEENVLAWRLVVLDVYRKEMIPIFNKTKCKEDGPKFNIKEIKDKGGDLSIYFEFDSHSFPKGFILAQEGFIEDFWENKNISDKIVTSCPKMKKRKIDTSPRKENGLIESVWE